MKEFAMYVIQRMPFNVLGPLVFLLVSAGLVFICPPSDKGKLIFLIVGAALTRVKISQPTPPERPEPKNPPADP